MALAAPAARSQARLAPTGGSIVQCGEGVGIGLDDLQKRACGSGRANAVLFPVLQRFGFDPDQARQFRGQFTQSGLAPVREASGNRLSTTILTETPGVGDPWTPGQMVAECAASECGRVNAAGKSFDRQPAQAVCLIMFARPDHQRIHEVLLALDATLLREHRCYFGGGTAIVLQRGEYRESALAREWALDAARSVAAPAVGSRAGSLLQGGGALGSGRRCRRAPAPQGRWRSEVASTRGVFRARVWRLERRGASPLAMTAGGGVGRAHVLQCSNVTTAWPG